MDRTMNNCEVPFQSQIGRRAFLRGGALMVAGAALSPAQIFAADEKKPLLKIGLVADLHYADKKNAGGRCYRESLAKLAEAAKTFDDEKPDLVVCMGDLIDSADSLDVEKGYAKRIAKDFAALPGKHHFVLGNHCVENLTKPEFLDIVGQEKSYYSFDTGEYHFVVLDACFTKKGASYGRKNSHWSDANVPAAELEWLRADLQQAKSKCIVFAHQCLDVKGSYGVKNGAEVRKALDDSGKVLAVFQGHYHPGNYQELANIHYCTLSAVVTGKGLKNNSYAMLDVLPGSVLRVRGLHKQKSFDWA